MGRGDAQFNAPLQNASSSGQCNPTGDFQRQNKPPKLPGCSLWGTVQGQLCGPLRRGPASACPSDLPVRSSQDLAALLSCSVLTRYNWTQIDDATAWPAPCFFFAAASFSFFLGYDGVPLTSCAVACSSWLAQPPADDTPPTPPPLRTAKQIVDGIIGDSAAANGLD